MERQNKPTIEDRIEFLEKKINTFSTGAARIIIISLLLILGNILIFIFIFKKPGGAIASCIISLGISIYILFKYLALYRHFSSEIGVKSK